MKRPVPRFMVVLDQASARHPLPEVARAAMAGGADMVQVRERKFATAELRALVTSVVDSVGDPLAVSINGEAALATELGTNLHLPESVEGDRTGIAVADGALLGRSIHSANIIWSVADVDYLILGNLFKTDSKPGKPGLGAVEFAEIAGTFGVPVLAIGGLRPETLSIAFDAGAFGMAVGSFVNSAVNPEQAAHAISDQIDRWLT